MISELMNAIIAASTGAITGGIVNLILEKRKERREDKKEKERENKEIYEKRPELQIVDYKNYLDRPGYGVKKDINIFLTKIEDVFVENEVVTAHFKKEYFNEDEWCCVIYSFKNIGNTDIRCINPICVEKKNMILCDVAIAHEILKHGLLHYTAWYDKKLRVGEIFTMKVCYHKECILPGNFSALMVMGIEDSNGRFWEQPLFVPNNKIYDASRLSQKEYKENIRSEKVIEYFKKPWLW